MVFFLLIIFLLHFQYFDYYTVGDIVCNGVFFYNYIFITLLVILSVLHRTPAPVSVPRQSVERFPRPDVMSSVMTRRKPVEEWTLGQCTEPEV